MFAALPPWTLAASDNSKVLWPHFFRDDALQAHDDMAGGDNGIDTKVWPRNMAAFAEDTDLEGVDGGQYRTSTECDDACLHSMYVLA